MTVRSYLSEQWSRFRETKFRNVSYWGPDALLMLSDGWSGTRVSVVRFQSHALGQAKALLYAHVYALLVHAVSSAPVRMLPTDGSLCCTHSPLLTLVCRPIDVCQALPVLGIDAWD